MHRSIYSLIVILAASSAAPAETCLEQTRVALEGISEALPRMTVAADAVARALAGGGSFWVGGHSALISEFAGRAGGLMLLKPLRSDEVEAGDAVLYVSGGEDHTEATAALAEKGVTLVCVGSEAPEGAFTVATALKAAPSPTLNDACIGWTFIAELIAALTRQGKMPVVYETIGLYGGYARIAEYDAKGIYWHETHEVPAIAPGLLGMQYINALRIILERVSGEEGSKLAEVGTWTAAARATGKRTIMYSMGHMFPNEVEETRIGTLFESAVWNSGFSQSTPPEDTYEAGDVVVHIGYQHPPYGLLPRARQAGAKVAYVDVLRHRDYPDGDGCLWIDPMWPWADGVVEIPNYDVPACPASGIVNAAIAWEIYRLSRDAMAVE